MTKPILCLDFDGVIHSYERGWQGGEIYGTVTPGFWEGAEEAQKHFKLVVYSSRSSTPETLDAMLLWMYFQRKKWRAAGGKSTDEALGFEFADKKPPAFLTIDDRALTFRGNWSDYPPEGLLTFKPWMTK